MPKFIMESPEDLKYGKIFNHEISGIVTVDKQFYWHLFKRVGWKDITPEGSDKFRIKSGEIKKIMLKHTSGLGDALFMTPVIKALAQRYPQAEIFVETNESGRLMLSGNPYLQPHNQRVHVNRDWLIPFIMDQFDVVVNFDGIIASNTESELKNCYDLFAEWTGITLKDEEKKPDIYFYNEELTAAYTLLKEWDIKNDQKIVTIQMESSSAIRNVDKIALINFAVKLRDEGYRPILFGQSNFTEYVFEQCECGEWIVAFRSHGINEVGYECKCGKKSLLKCGADVPTGIPGVYFFDPAKYTVKTAAVLIANSEFFIGPDSVGMHIAASFDKPSLGFFSSFDGDLRMRYYKHGRWLQIDYPCAPCFNHGKSCRKNPKGIPPCLSKIDGDMIYQEFKKMEKGEPFHKPLPFEPTENIRPCPVCGETLEREYVCRKGTVCYYKCDCTTIYTDKEVPVVNNEQGYYEEFTKEAYIKGQHGSGAMLHKKFSGQNFLNRVLDVGCGIAHTIGFMQQLGWDVYGIDNSTKAIEESEKIYPALKGRIMNVNFLEYEDNKLYSLIWMNNVLEHFHNPNEIFKKVSRLLEHGGIFSVQIPDADLWIKQKLSANWDGVINSYAGEHSVLMTLKSLRYIAGLYGFKILEKDPKAGPDCLWVHMQKTK